MVAKRLSQKHPILFFVAIWRQRCLRYWRNSKERQKFALKRQAESLPHRVFSHQSKLIRNFGEDYHQLQVNKITNLKKAIPLLDGIVIHPGETFSFYKLVGHAHRLRGFRKGLELSGDTMRAGIGGGLCQIANMLHWLILHSNLDIIEHHHHSRDMFRDDERLVPFGCGATIFYNYLDYRFTNNSPNIWQLRLSLDENHLIGDILVNDTLNVKYDICEKNHSFLQCEGKFYRFNEIWRQQWQGDSLISETLYRKNIAPMMYVPDVFDVVDSLKDFQ
ncbi:VanW family protein [Bartonella sp. HY038]|uniref:VanW family protein n=1 Tax=Bartonella sp. HY038 TaxID=2759660 RepID=UPI0015FE119F|nr:VanW family protein [Bartonella sp. HY038]